MPLDVLVNLGRFPLIMGPHAFAHARSHKFWLLVALYLAQGLPYGFFTQAMPVLLREQGYSLKAISLLSLLAWPWVLKFLWAPYLDHVGTRKHWLLGLQIASVIAALILTQLGLDRGIAVLLIAALTFNVIAASQDVLTDGIAVRFLSVRERGLGNGIQVGAYRVGMILGGGLLLWVFARAGWSVTFVCMAGLLALTILPVLSLREPAAPPVSRPTVMQLSVGWAQRLAAPGVPAFIGLLFCYRFGDAVISTLFGPFLSDAGLSKETIALMKGTVGSATSVIGAIVGGIFVLKVGRRFALLFSGLAQAACFVLYLIAALHIGGVSLLWAATICEGVLSTMATVALFTLMMDASDPQHAGTDYTLYASAIVLITSLGGFTGGALGDALGYATTFTVGIALSLLGVWALVRVLDRRAVPERVALAWRGNDTAPSHQTAEIA